MTHHPYLSGEHNILSYMGRSCQPDLGTKQGIFSHRRSMADLDQIINLDAAGDLGVADAGPVDAGIGLNFHLVAEHRPPRFA